MKLAKKIQNTPSMQIYNQKVGRPKFADPTRISAKPTDNGSATSLLMGQL